MPEADGRRGRCDAVRHFNRFYTRQLGLLDEGLLHTRFSLTEARVLYEMAQRERATAAEFCQDLGLDAGYLSRILGGFQKRRLVQRRRSPHDARHQLLSLTGRGRAAFAELNELSRKQVDALLARLAPDDQARLVAAMARIEALLTDPSERRVPYLLRQHQPGDMGWVVERHGALYSQEYGWDETFEALVAEIVASFLRNYDARRERCWIAERDGERVGSAFVVKHPEREGVAKLRLLIVEPAARGLGIGGRLVGECTRFARQAGYRTLTLWTNSILDAARKLYVREGYQLVKSEPHESFGHQLVGETWELAL
jgi:DNA-binding MarR family transcriptional regulator/GNAT superfamily N-acetyltransferase